MIKRPFPSLFVDHSDEIELHSFPLRGEPRFHFLDELFEPEDSELFFPESCPFINSFLFPENYLLYDHLLCRYLHSLISFHIYNSDVS